MKDSILNPHNVLIDPISEVIFEEGPMASCQIRHAPYAGLWYKGISVSCDNGYKGYAPSLSGRAYNTKEEARTAAINECIEYAKGKDEPTAKKMYKTLLQIRDQKSLF